MSRHAAVDELVRQGLLTEAQGAALERSGTLPTSYGDLGQGSAVADATGGATVDAEARTALNALLAELRTLGIIAT